MKNVIEAIILNGKYQGENILLPRIPIIPTDVSKQFKRLQFPIFLFFLLFTYYKYIFDRITY
jgi:ATP-dependent DNA helicase PIF1